MRHKINRFLKNIPFLFKIWDSSLKIIDTNYYKKHCSNYTIIPFGNYCMPRFIVTECRLKPRKYYGEKTCPFDLLLCSNFEANTELFDTHFEHFYDDIERSEKFKTWVSKKNDIIFLHDGNTTLEQLKERYDVRIKNLYDYVNDKTKHLYFLTAISRNIEEAFGKKECSFIDEEKIKKLINAVKKYRDEEDFDIIIINQSYKPIYTDIKNVHIIDLVYDKDFDAVNDKYDWLNELVKQRTKVAERFYSKLTKELRNIIQKKKYKYKLEFPIPFIRASLRNPRYLKNMKNLNHEYEIKNTYKEIPKVLSKEDAVDVLLNSKKSLSRYGDGEFSLVDGEDLAFQNCDKELQRRLTEILKSGNENLLVGLPDVFSSLKQYIPKYEDYWRNWIVVKRPSIYKMLDMSKTYCSSFISRPYMAYKDKKNVINFFKKVRKLWENRDIVVVEGKFSTLGVSNDLFKNAKSIKRILCPAINAYSKYDEILEFCQSFSKDTLFILALGPTATVLADDLSKSGYQALDLGNIDVEYIWCLKKTKKKIPIENKFVWEAGCSTNIGKEESPEYQEQIIKTIL